MVRICFVCMGNICRSPTAEAVMRRLIEERGLTKRFAIESAGTGDWHVGEPADGRSPPDPADRPGRQRARGRGGHVRTRGSTAATTMSATMLATTTASENSRKIACSSGTSGPRIAW